MTPTIRVNQGLNDSPQRVSNETCGDSKEYDAAERHVMHHLEGAVGISGAATWAEGRLRGDQTNSYV
jgi:hypothetical protein